VCIVAVQPGERERPCEIVTPPLTEDAESALAFLLDEARMAGFTIPHEAAAHVHFDGERLRNAGVIANLARALTRHGAALKKLVGTNSNCVRLGHWPRPFIKLAADPDFIDLEWSRALLPLKECKLSKFCDFNLANIIHENPKKPTFEARIFPVSFDAGRLLEAALLFESILHWAVETKPQTARIADTLQAFITGLGGDPAVRDLWRGHAKQKGIA
jgi:hypothetical protein